MPAHAHQGLYSTNFTTESCTMLTAGAPARHPRACPPIPAGWGLPGPLWPSVQCCGRQRTQHTCGCRAVQQGGRAAAEQPGGGWTEGGKAAGQLQHCTDQQGVRVAAERRAQAERGTLFLLSRHVCHSAQRQPGRLLRGQFAPVASSAAHAVKPLVRSLFCPAFALKTTPAPSHALTSTTLGAVHQCDVVEAAADPFQGCAK